MRTKRPYDCGSEEECCELQTSHHELKDWWILTDGYTISIHKQRNGEKSTQEVQVPKRQFDALVGWYMAQQEVRP